MRWFKIGGCTQLRQDFLLAELETHYVPLESRIAWTLSSGIPAGSAVRTSVFEGAYLHLHGVYTRAGNRHKVMEAYLWVKVTNKLSCHGCQCWNRR